ncbi:hypothetical protein BCR32DRAFT_289678 [Anaeromyces robustus]|uniref:TPR-like protein n=1 Tax=Anaeromyces robustus TaxID=1754192 RepID=A0A1Y1XMA0_9FUNG|nr:hypothetical protein BCR32DRAFT_289678 [Anaeromyces robustus]|eukprot:ORX86879.1 hypothetical protein BCR32DRAFT_289678 [Anaeromyces robustus]
MNIEKLQNEVDDFCSFADEYSSKMNDILNGKLSEKDIDNYLNNIENNNTTNLEKNNNVNKNENKVLSTNSQKEARNIKLNTVQKSVDNKENKEKNFLKISEKENNKEPNKLNNIKEKGIDYSKWEHFGENESDNEQEKEDIQKTTNQKKTEKKIKWKERVLNKIESHKEKGNTYYKKYKFEEAIEEYTIAINTAKSPDQELVFGTSELNFMPYKSSFYAVPVDFALYNNRALCYLRLKKYNEVINDCTEALNIQSNSIKALWRRASAYQELKNHELALKDLYKLKKLIENEEKDVNIENNLISLKNINERIELYENEFKQYKDDKKILKEINDSNNKIDNISLDFWINRTLKTIISSKLIKSNKSIENNNTVMIESKNCKMAVLTLINSFRIYPEMIDIFRATNSFQKFTNDTALSIETFNNVVSILVEACLDSEKNTNEMSKYIHIIIGIIVNEFKINNINIIDNKNIQNKKIPSSLKYSHFCSFIHLFSVCFKNKIFFEKAVYNILNPDVLPYLSTFLQFYIKRSCENIKNNKEKFTEQNINNKDSNEIKNKNIKLHKLYQNCTKYIIDWIYYILHNENKVDGNYLLEKIGIKLSLIQELFSESILHHWIEKLPETKGKGKEKGKSKIFYNNIIIENLLEIFNYQINQTKRVTELKKHSLYNVKEKQSIYSYNTSQYLQFLENIKLTILLIFKEAHENIEKNDSYNTLYNKNTLLPCLHNYLLLLNNHGKSISEINLNEYNILDYLIDDLSKSKNEKEFNLNLQWYDTINLILIKLYRIIPSYVEIQLKNNWNNKLSIFFKSLFSNIMKTSQVNTMNNEKMDSSKDNNIKYSNLLYFLNNIHYIDTFLQLLFICLKNNKSEYSFEDNENYSNIINDWDSKYNGYTIFKFIFLNIKSLWIYNNQKDFKNDLSIKIHEIENDKEEENLNKLKETLLLNSIEKNKESFSKVIGNTALCISECADNINECKKLEKYQIIDDILYFLRELTNIQTQTNLAIACSRLIKSEKIQSEFRKKGGFQLLHNLGPKILNKH